MGEANYVIGVVISVDGDQTLIGTYDLINDDEIIHNGQILYGPRLGAYVTVRQNDVKLIAKITSEKVIDQQNTIRSNEFDNRYSKNSINRLISVKMLGAIEDNQFIVTSSYAPMVGNEAYITTQAELSAIYAIGRNTDSIAIGTALLERSKVLIPINAFFAGHIGIFGNTGSGKSNTLHALYYKLLHSKYREGILKKSRFTVIDFNGEYRSEGIFGFPEDRIERYNVDTRSQKGMAKKVKVSEDYIINPDVLIMLFEAKPGVQAPFIRRSLNVFEEVKEPEPFMKLCMGLLQKIILTGNATNDDALGDWVEVTENCCGADCLSQLRELRHYTNGSSTIQDSSGSSIWFNPQDQTISDEGKKRLGWEGISSAIQNKYKSLSILDKLHMFFRYQRVYSTAWNGTDPQYLGPMFSRIKTRLESLNKVVDIVPAAQMGNAYRSGKPLTIYSFVHANQEIKRILPMLIANMIYGEQKKEESDTRSINRTSHLIIDEAHNILSDIQRDDGDNWQNHRLDSFEEIIKEGRKFGFYLTIASQRPADISSTILSQIHNYIIHRLVNDRDLRSLENTMPTLDHSSLMTIPSLGKGQAVLTGTAFPVPRFTQVDRIIKVAPASDDAELTRLWGSHENEAKPDSVASTIMVSGSDGANPVQDASDTRFQESKQNDDWV